MADEAPEKPPERPSLAFSWATLGFILGALFVLALPPGGRNHGAPPPQQPAPQPDRMEPAPSEIPAKKLPPVRLTTIEAVFEDWAQYADWNNDTTEVALFDPETKDFTDCYQVVRAEGNVYFFRTIPRLTLPVLTHGVPANSPLRFTETDAHHQQWLHDVNEENWRQIQGALTHPQPGAEPPAPHP